MPVSNSEKLSSFHLVATSPYAKLDKPVIYANIHWHGGAIRAKVVNNLKLQVGGRWVSKPEVTIPPQPFFPVLNGWLTQAAERVIGSAGERAVLREVDNNYEQTCNHDPGCIRTPVAELQE